MNATDRFRLLGKYRTPRVRLGEVITCESRDRDLVVVAISNGRIPWPIGRPKGESAKSLILYDDLARAVRKESNQAVCHWFGVTPQTVSKWRKALGVELSNAGTHRLRSDYTDEPWAVEALKKANAKAGDPERRRKIAEAKKGKKRPAHVVEAVRQAHLGTKHPMRTRAKMARSHRKQPPAKPPSPEPYRLEWTKKDDELVRTLSPKKAARSTGHSLAAVYRRRWQLKRMPDSLKG